MNKHFDTYVYIWGNECIKVMSGVVPKNLSPPSRTVKCDQRFVNSKLFT